MTKVVALLALALLFLVLASNQMLPDLEILERDARATVSAIHATATADQVEWSAHRTERATWGRAVTPTPPVLPRTPKPPGGSGSGVTN